MPATGSSQPLWLRAGEVEMRPFEPGLAETVLAVRNHETVRRNMRDSSPIALASHMRWLQDNVVDTRRVHLFVVLEHEAPVGIGLLRDYQVTSEVMEATGNPQAKFLHCLPAFHDRHTKVGEDIYQRTGLEALEVTDEVFESSRSIVFDQAENRKHTIKAVLVATLGG